MRIRGAGTFVTDSRYRSTLIEILNIAEEIKSRGHQHTSEVLPLEQTSAPEALEALRLPPDGLAFHSRMVHFENKVPIQSEDRRASGVLFPDYINQDFRALTPNDYMTSLVPAQGVE
ncbi:UTRA domain-containing protein [Paraburkholderia xenovorans]|uniref:UTRA domain-containing protein n=1 Tax=Paraburkholderia xenovorans TaxID=36873 RepID=UPI0038B9D112